MKTVFRIFGIIMITGLFVITACDIPSGNGKTQIAKPALEVDQFTYNGSEHTVALTAANSAYTLGGDITKTEVGNYTATVTLSNTNNFEWADGTTAPLSLNWSIGKQQIAKPALAQSQFIHTGEPHTVTLTAANAAYTLGGDITKTDIDNYIATVTLTDTDNSEWADGTSEPLNLNWSISSKTQIAKPALEVDQFTYNGSAQTVSLTATNAAYTLSGQTQTNVGNYTATVTLTNTDNYEWEDGTSEPLNLNWSIGKQQLTKPALTTNQFNYTGTAHTVTLTAANAAYTLGGQTTGTAVGSYTATVTLTDTNNYEWEDGTSEPLNLNWSIGKQQLTKPALTTNQFNYTGTAHTVTLTAANEVYTLGGQTTGTAVGSYTATVTLTDTNNYEWADGTSEQLGLTWSINKANPNVTWPTASAITYGAALSTSTLSGGSGSGSFAWTNGDVIPTVTNSGYEVTFTPSDTANYNILTQAVTITVNKANPNVTTWPTASAITYGAALSTSTLSGGSGSGVFAWTNGTVIPTVTNSGYEVTFTPSDTANYNILKQAVAITVYKANPNVTWPRAYDIEYYGEALSTTRFWGGSGNGVFAWTDGTIIPTVINSGYEVTFTPSDTANYNILTQNVAITVNKALIVTPQLTINVFHHNGNEHTITLNWGWSDPNDWHDADIYILGGDIKKTEGGTYTATVTLTDTDNYEWWDGTTEPLKLNWLIINPSLFSGTWTRTQGNFNPHTITITENSFHFKSSPASMINEFFINHEGITWVEADNTATTHETPNTSPPYDGIFRRVNPSDYYPIGFTISGTRTVHGWSDQIPVGFFIALSADGNSLYLAESASTYNIAGFGHIVMTFDSIFTRVTE